ncbi:hypothetical protein PpBr36_01160 [Pyricularia pennisetigena]|uniref:hypothetical protein n=1 Tax=Pyricularia pennisetigena TaxID=1578925 RepID=UPI001153E636|nr:hypothetical protein PpBr36_01160 [Pyricularia pennisetigena]TLS28331.1 hypothetical protein PpBr36_01160 [Pyricularia pennisetigena]
MRLAGATRKQGIAAVVGNQACWLIGWLWGLLSVCKDEEVNQPREVPRGEWARVRGTTNWFQSTVRRTGPVPYLTTVQSVRVACVLGW